MDNLPAWAVWIAALAVGVAPGLAILRAPRIARLFYRLLWARRGWRPNRKPSRLTNSQSAPQGDRSGRGAAGGTGNGQYLTMEPVRRVCDASEMGRRYTDSPCLLKPSCRVALCKGRFGLRELDPA